MLWLTGAVVLCTMISRMLVRLMHDVIRRRRYEHALLVGVRLRRRCDNHALGFGDIGRIDIKNDRLPNSSRLRSLVCVTVLDG